MKRIIAMLLAAICVISLCACEKNASYEEKEAFLDKFGGNDENDPAENKEYEGEEMKVYVVFTSVINGEQGDAYLDKEVYYPGEYDVTVRDIVEYILEEEDVSYEFAAYGGTLSMAFGNKSYGEMNDEYAAAGMWTCEVNGSLATAETVVEEYDEIIYKWTENIVYK